MGHLQMSDGGEVGQVSNPIRLSPTPASYDTAPPALGEHTDEIRAWLEDENADPLARFRAPHREVASRNSSVAGSHSHPSTSKARV
jgi:crotonobetainyl-CoA:carnitine CoA-transferase CaiB-like acyl-CoA transferase